jgi:hypothetical protein
VISRRKDDAASGASSVEIAFPPRAAFVAVDGFAAARDMISDRIQKLLFLKSCRNARLKPPQDKPE